MKDWRYAERIATLPSVPLGLTHLLPQVPGLYIAVIYDLLGCSFVGYVGISTASLYARWNSHRGNHVRDKAKALLALAAQARMGTEPCYVLVHYDVTTPPQMLRAVEAEIIALWNPPLNAPHWGAGNTPLLITPAIGAASYKRLPVYASPSNTASWAIDCHALAKEIRSKKE